MDNVTNVHHGHWKRPTTKELCFIHDWHCRCKKTYKTLELLDKEKVTWQLVYSLYHDRFESATKNHWHEEDMIVESIEKVGKISLFYLKCLLALFRLSRHSKDWHYILVIFLAYNVRKPRYTQWCKYPANAHLIWDRFPSGSHWDCFSNLKISHTNIAVNEKIYIIIIHLNYNLYVQ